jgi:hypothetical protein
MHPMLSNGPGGRVIDLETRQVFTPRGYFTMLRPTSIFVTSPLTGSGADVYGIV